MIPKSASLIGTITTDIPDERITFWLSCNRSTGEARVHCLSTLARRPRQLSGRNLKAFVADLEHLLNEGTCAWVDTPSDAALAALRDLAG